MPATRVDIEGLADFQRALRGVDAAMPREIRVANLEVAELVASKARSRALSKGSTAAKVADDIKAMAQQRYAIVRLGRLHAFTLGAEFGSIQFKQFKAWTGNRWTDPEGLDTGYFLHPTIRDEVRSGEVLKQYLKRLESIDREAFPD